MSPRSTKELPSAERFSIHGFKAPGYSITYKHYEDGEYAQERSIVIDELEINGQQTVNMTDARQVFRRYSEQIDLYISMIETALIELNSKNAVIITQSKYNQDFDTQDFDLHSDLKSVKTKYKAFLTRNIQYSDIIE